MSCTRLLSLEQLVFLVLGNREPTEPSDEDASDDELRAPEQEHPPRKGDRLMGRG